MLTLEDLTSSYGFEGSLIILSILSFYVTKFLSYLITLQIDSSELFLWAMKIITFILIIGWLSWSIDAFFDWIYDYPNLDKHIDEFLQKGYGLVIFWMIFTLQLFYRIEFNRGSRQNK